METTGFNGEIIKLFTDEHHIPMFLVDNETVKTYKLNETKCFRFMNGSFKDAMEIKKGVLWNVIKVEVCDGKSKITSPNFVVNDLLGQGMLL